MTARQNAIPSLTPVAYAIRAAIMSDAFAQQVTTAPRSRA